MEKTAGRSVAWSSSLLGLAALEYSVDLQQVTGLSIDKPLFNAHEVESVAIHQDTKLIDEISPEYSGTRDISICTARILPSQRSAPFNTLLSKPCVSILR